MNEATPSPADAREHSPLLPARRKLRLVFGVAAILFMMGIWWGSSQLPHTASGKPAWWSQMIDRIPFRDKGAHLTEYTLLGFLLGGIRWRRSKWSAVLVGWTYAAIDEWHQSWVPGRESSAADWLADAAGILLGCLLVILLEVLYDRWQRRHLLRHGGGTLPRR